jgi:hypothetical protein
VTLSGGHSWLVIRKAGSRMPALHGLPSCLFVAWGSGWATILHLVHRTETSARSVWAVGFGWENRILSREAHFNFQREVQFTSNVSIRRSGTPDGALTTCGE